MWLRQEHFNKEKSKGKQKCLERLDFGICIFRTRFPWPIYWPLRRKADHILFCLQRRKRSWYCLLRGRCEAQRSFQKEKDVALPVTQHTEIWKIGLIEQRCSQKKELLELRENFVCGPLCLANSKETNCAQSELSLEKAIHHHFIKRLRFWSLRSLTPNPPSVHTCFQFARFNPPP